MMDIDEEKEKMMTEKITKCKKDKTCKKDFGEKQNKRKQKKGENSLKIRYQKIKKKFRKYFPFNEEHFKS